MEQSVKVQDFRVPTSSQYLNFISDTGGIGTAVPDNFNFERDILQRVPGSRVEMRAENASGLRDIVKGEVLYDNSIDISIESKKLPGKKNKLHFQPLGQNTWRISNQLRSETLYIPEILPLDFLLTLVWSAHTVDGWFVDKVNASERKKKYLKSSNTFNASRGFLQHPSQAVPQRELSSTSIDSLLNPLQKRQFSYPPQTPQEFRNPGPCVGHDLVCSDIDLIGITFINGRGFTTNVPCVGDVVVDVLDCCQQHDIDLWCADNATEAGWANAKVAACVTARVLAEQARRFDQEANWWCKFKQLLKGLLDFILGALATLISAIAGLLGDALVVLLEILSLGLFPKDWGDFLKSGAGFINPGDENVLGNYNGQHSGSCLCGGTDPTFLCGNECRNLCSEFDKDDDCLNCGCVCDYSNGRLIGTHFESPSGVRTPPFNDNGCCPGTGFNCNRLNRFIANPCAGLRCPTCTFCHLGCDTGKWEIVRANPQIRQCCNNVDQGKIGKKCEPGTLF